MSTKTLTNADVLDIVKRYVERNQQPDRRLVVKDQGVVHVDKGVPAGDDRWYVEVHPESDDESHYGWFAEHVSHISEQIKAEEGLDVELGTILPPLWL